MTSILFGSRSNKIYIYIYIKGGVKIRFFLTQTNQLKRNDKVGTGFFRPVTGFHVLATFVNFPTAPFNVAESTSINDDDPSLKSLSRPAFTRLDAFQ